MTEASPHRSLPEAADASGPTAGALLNEEQVRWLRRAVIGMTAVLVAGFFLLIGRVIYLARGGGTQVTSASTPQPQLLPEIRAVLPEGAVVKAISATGSRVVILHGSPGRMDEMSVLDLATGRIESHVGFDVK